MAEQEGQDDLSAGEVPLSKQALLKNEIRKAQDVIRFRRITFYSSTAIALLLFAILIWYLVFSCRDIGSERIAIAAILGAVPTLLIMALLRYSFSDGTSKSNNDKDDFSVWQSLAKEFLNIWKGKP